MLYHQEAELSLYVSTPRGLKYSGADSLQGPPTLKKFHP